MSGGISVASRPKNAQHATSFEEQREINIYAYLSGIRADHGNFIMKEPSARIN